MPHKGAGVQVPFVILQIRACRGVVAEKAGYFPGGDAHYKRRSFRFDYANRKVNSFGSKAS